MWEYVLPNSCKNIEDILKSYQKHVEECADKARVIQVR